MPNAKEKYLTKHGFEQFEPKAVLFDMDGNGRWRCSAST